MQEEVTGRGLQEQGCRSRVAGRGYRKRVAGAGLQEGVAGRGVIGSKKGCRKGLRERRHSRNPLTQPLFGGVGRRTERFSRVVTDTHTDRLATDRQASDRRVITDRPIDRQTD